MLRLKNVESLHFYHHQQLFPRRTSFFAKSLKALFRCRTKLKVLPTDTWEESGLSEVLHTVETASFNGNVSVQLVFDTVATIEKIIIIRTILVIVDT